MSRSQTVLLVVGFLWAAVARGAADVPKWVDWDPAKQGEFISAMAVAGPKAYAASDEKGLWCLQPDGSGWKPCDITGVKGDFVRSLAIDHQGRLWAGLGFHGVSVFDGNAWKNYDAPDGPLGHRVFYIAVNPVDGDVWLATDLGLTRYSVKSDRWFWFTRCDGLPSDQASALVFDREGVLYVGTQCEGIAISSPADDYKTWRTVTGPDRAPVESAGKGLPSNLINGLKIAADGSIFAATDGGLAVSRDHGVSWNFYRGEDCYAKVEGRTGGPPDNWQQPNDVPLLDEDYCTCLAIDLNNHLWVGHRKTPVDQIDCATMKKISPLPDDPKPKLPITSVLLVADEQSLWVGTGGKGAVCEPLEAPKVHAAKTDNFTVNTQPLLPSPATIGPRQFDRLKSILASAPHTDLTAAFLGDDWVTRGDGAGRYGCQKVCFPFYGIGGWASGYDVQVSVGPNAPRGGPCYWFDKNDADDTRVLYLPNAFKRLQGEWNDASFGKAYHPSNEGPDLWLKIIVPDAGVHRLSLFFINYDGHESPNTLRDFLVQVKDGSLDKKDADFAPSLARTRVCEFYQPVYKQFLLAGGHPYWIKIDRNYSFESKLSGIFFDRMKGTAPQEIDSLPHPLLDAAHWGPPKFPAVDSNTPSSVREARQLWDDLDTRYDDASTIAMQLPLRMQAYKVAADNHADEQLLANWRWKLSLWDEASRLEFCKQMDAGYDKTIAQNPQVAKEDRVKMEDQFKTAEP
jgi:hypothetical protein